MYIAYCAKSFKAVLKHDFNYCAILLHNHLANLVIISGKWLLGPRIQAIWLDYPFGCLYNLL